MPDYVPFFDTFFMGPSLERNQKSHSEKFLLFPVGVKPICLAISETERPY